MHQKDRTIHALVLQSIFQTAQIGLHQRLDISVCDNRIEPLVLPHLRADLGRNRDHDVRQFLGQYRADQALMDVVQITVDQPHGDTFKSGFGDLVYHHFNSSPVKRDHHLAQSIHTLGHRKPHLTRQKRLGQDQIQIVLLKPAFGSHLDHVAEPFGGNQGSLCPTPFDQGIGRQRRAMDDLNDLPGQDT